MGIIFQRLLNGKKIRGVIYLRDRMYAIRVHFCTYFIWKKEGRKETGTARTFPA